MLWNSDPLSPVPQPVSSDGTYNGAPAEPKWSRGAEDAVVAIDTFIQGLICKSGLCQGRSG